MESDHSFRDEIDKVVKAFGFEQNEPFITVLDYAFQPFYAIASPEREISPVIMVSLLTEFEKRMNEKSAEQPVLNDPKFKEMIVQILRALLVSPFNDKSIESGLKYHLADAFESTVKDVVYIKSGGENSEGLKEDIVFMRSKKERYRDSKKGEDLQEFWRLKDMELMEEKALLLPGDFIYRLELLLKKHKLISENDNLKLAFSATPIESAHYVHWMGSQLSLMFMFYNICGGPEFNNQSLFSFVADRFLVKSKNVTPLKLNNTYFNLVDKYLNRNRSALTTPLIKIAEIISLAFSGSENKK